MRRFPPPRPTRRGLPGTSGRLTAADADDDATPGVSEAGEPECPNLARLGDRWLLVESGGGGSQQVRYRSGSFDPKAIQFHVAAAGIVDHAYGPKWPDDASRGFYGTNLVTAPDGRVVLLGWAGGFKPGRAWNSCMGLPRELSLDDAGLLLQSPVRRLPSSWLRGRPPPRPSRSSPTRSR